MKKALLAALTFIVVGFLLVNGTLALPDLETVFATVAELLDKAAPEPGGDVVNVSLVTDKTPQQLYPGGWASRVTRVRNDGTGAVYFRLIYAIQYDESSWDKLSISFAADGEGFSAPVWKDTTIGGTPYKMAVLTYTEALPAGEHSPAVTLTIAMDSTVTSAEIARYREDFLQTQVLAIETTAFEERTATAALDLALPINSDFNPF